MATFSKFQQFVEDRFKGVHDFTSDATCTVKIALCAAANAPVATNSVLADLTTVSLANADTDIVTGITAEHTSGTVTMTATDLTVTASGGDIGPFRYLVLYNDDPTSPADPLMVWADLGSDITVTDGNSITFNFTTDAIITAT